MYPVWILTLGLRNYSSCIDIEIDYHYVIRPVFYSIIPFCFGLLIQYFWPQSKDCAMTTLKVFSQYHILTSSAVLVFLSTNDLESPMKYPAFKVNNKNMSLLHHFEFVNFAFCCSLFWLDFFCRSLDIMLDGLWQWDLKESVKIVYLLPLNQPFKAKVFT